MRKQEEKEETNVTVESVEVETPEAPAENVEKKSGKEISIKIAKRALDIFSGVVLLIVTSWIILLSALVKFCEDFHNPFFAGKRMSVKGKEYTHFKIRTMCIHAAELETQLIEAGLNEAEEIPFRMKNDPRITTVGKFLRRYYLDRFPAFINVIAGQITIFDIFKKRETEL